MDNTVVDPHCISNLHYRKAQTLTGEPVKVTRPFRQYDFSAAGNSLVSVAVKPAVWAVMLPGDTVAWKFSQLGPDAHWTVIETGRTIALYNDTFGTVYPSDTGGLHVDQLTLICGEPSPLRLLNPGLQWKLNR